MSAPLRSLLGMDGTPRPAASTLTEDWSSGTINAAKWNTTGAPTVVAGRLRITPTTAYPDVRSIDNYNLMGSAFVVEAPTMPTMRSGIEVAMAVWAPDSSNSYDFLNSNGVLILRADGVEVTSFTYSATTHRWWRLRESGGTVFWDTSPDGTTWTQQASQAATALNVANVRLELYAGDFAGGTVTGFAEFDNINPLPPSASASGSITLGGTTTARAVITGTATLGEVAADVAVTCPVPTGVTAGELLVVAVAHADVSAAIPDQTGWTTAAKATLTNGSVQNAVFYRVATGSEPASYTFTGLNPAAAGRATAEMVRLAGVDATTALDVAAVTANGTGTSLTTPSITTVTAGAMVIYAISRQTATASDITPDSRTSLLIDTTGTGRRTILAGEQRSAAGATGTRTWASTDATSLVMLGCVVAFRPATSLVTAPTVTGGSSGSVSLAGTTSAASAGVAASSSGSITLGGTATASAVAAPAGSISLGGTATASAVAAPAGSITLAGSGTARAAATTTGSVTLGGSASATAPVSAAGTVSLGGTATARAATTATGSVTLGGSQAASGATSATGSITLGGSQTARAATTGAGGITLGGTANYVRAKISTFTEAFDTLDTERWNVFPPVTVTGGQLRIDSNSSWTGAVETKTRYDLTGSSLTFELVQLAASVAYVDMYVYLQASAGNNISVDIETNGGGTLVTLGTTLGGVYGPHGNVGYDPAAMRFLRFREAGGTVFLDTAPADGSTWTQRASWVISGINPADLYLGLGTGGDAEGTAPVVFDNINLLPAAASASATGSITLGGTATARAASSATGSITLGGSAPAAAAAAGLGSVALGGAPVARAAATAAGTISLGGSTGTAAAATTSGTISLGGSVTASAAAAASGTVTLGGSVAALSSVTLSGSVSLGGASTARAVATASGTVTLGGTAASGATPASASGTISLGGTATARAAATASGTVSLGGTATVAAVAAASGTVSLGGTATVAAGAAASGTISLGGTAASGGTPAAASGSITLGGTATARAAAAAAGTITLGGSAALAATAATSGTVTLAGAATAASGDLPASASGTVTLGGTTTARAVAAASGTVTLGGAASSVAPVAASGSVTLGGSMPGAWPVAGAGLIVLGGAVIGRAPAAAGGTIVLGGAITAAVPATLAGLITLSGIANAKAMSEVAALSGRLVTRQLTGLLITRQLTGRLRTSHLTGTLATRSLTGTLKE